MDFDQRVLAVACMESISERTRYDVFHVENWSLAFDVKILLKTLGAVFRDRNAY